LAGSKKLHEKLVTYLRTKAFNLREETPLGKNNPFHFAIANQNLKGFRTLCEAGVKEDVFDIIINSRNKDGLSPADFMSMFSSH
jgi:hypothetical protein